MHYTRDDEIERNYNLESLEKSKKFGGRERLSAIEYADELAKEYGAEIRKEGF